MLGAAARYGVSAATGSTPDGFPWATFWTNVSGSLLLGLLLAFLLSRFPPSRYLRPFLATGVLGAYTTYSTFAVETDLLIRAGKAGTAFGYAAASLVAGTAAAAVGIMLVRRLAGAPR